MGPFVTVAMLWILFFLLPFDLTYYPRALYPDLMSGAIYESTTHRR